MEILNLIIALLGKVIRQDISNSFDDNMVFFNMMTLWGDA